MRSGTPFSNRQRTRSIGSAFAAATVSAAMDAWSAFVTRTSGARKSPPTPPRALAPSTPLQKPNKLWAQCLPSAPLRPLMPCNPTAQGAPAAGAAELAYASVARSTVLIGGYWLADVHSTQVLGRRLQPETERPLLPLKPLGRTDQRSSTIGSSVNS
jgi:hypothetical protein